MTTMFPSAFYQISLNLPEDIRLAVIAEDWITLDRLLERETKAGGTIYHAISAFIAIEQVEHIIAIRRGGDDEDGIWHDDGSRQLAFTLSLVEDLDQLQGGILQLRPKNKPATLELIPTPAYGTLTIIKTGHHGFEHCLLKVQKGLRIICAGWIN